MIGISVIVLLYEMGLMYGTEKKEKQQLTWRYLSNMALD
jgi:hypothetical protein